MGTPDVPTMTLCYAVTTSNHTTNVEQLVTVHPHNRAGCETVPAAQMPDSQHKCTHGTATRGACSRRTDYSPITQPSYAPAATAVTLPPTDCD
jgi:hypothetical protein